jgi:hypothetical protein
MSGEVRSRAGPQRCSGLNDEEKRCLTTVRQSVGLTGKRIGGTEGVNLIIEKVRRLAHGFKDFDHYRLGICSPRMTAAIQNQTKPNQTMLKSEDHPIARISDADDV